MGTSGKLWRPTVSSLSPLHQPEAIASNASTSISGSAPQLRTSLAHSKNVFWAKKVDFCTGEVLFFRHQVKAKLQRQWNCFSPAWHCFRKIEGKVRRSLLACWYILALQHVNDCMVHKAEAGWCYEPLRCRGILPAPCPEPFQVPCVFCMCYSPGRTEESRNVQTTPSTMCLSLSIIDRGFGASLNYLQNTTHFSSRNSVHHKQS